MLILFFSMMVMVMFRFWEVMVVVVLWLRMTMLVLSIVVMMVIMFGTADMVRFGVKLLGFWSLTVILTIMM